MFELHLEFQALNLRCETKLRVISIDYQISKDYANCPGKPKHCV